MLIGILGRSRQTPAYIRIVRQRTESTALGCDAKVAVAEHRVEAALIIDYLL